MADATPRYSLSEMKPRDPILGFRGSYRWMSNFWRVPGLTAYGIPCPTVEHAYVIAKIAPDRSDRMALAREIASLPSPADAKRRGRRIELRPDWEDVKGDMMATLLARKFAPGTAMSEKLSATGRRPIFELNTWGDVEWGVIALADGDTLKGRNLMGRLLETRRAALMNEPEQLRKDESLEEDVAAAVEDVPGP